MLEADKILIQAPETEKVMTLEEWCRTPEALERQQRNEDALARAKARPQEIEEDEG